MATMHTTPLKIKIFDETKGKIRWVKICDIGTELYSTFLNEMGVNEEEYADYIAEWFFREYNLNLSMTTMRDVKILLGSIKERYRAVYPAIYNNTDIDAETWVRIWLSKRMEEELTGVRVY